MSAVLADRVHVRRRFQKAIRVDTDIGPAALEGFTCPPSAAEALLTMATQIRETGQGAFTWTGPYGCGKSSLAVALAALLGQGGPKRQAREAFGEVVAARLKAQLNPSGCGWQILPLTGSRADPAVAVERALDGRLPSQRGRRKPKPSGDVITRLLNHAARKGVAGLMLIVDEMGKFLEEAALGRVDVYFFQQLAEAASRSNGRLVVIGILHQAFDDYAYRLGREARDGWLKIQGRFADIPINVAGEEQIDLIARAVEADPAPEVFVARAASVARAVRAQRPGTGATLGGRLAECWPLDPIVASLLGPLSRRRFGQNQRSVFGFLNSAEPFGFQEYLKSTLLGAVVPYSTVALWDYLRSNIEPSILASPDGHRWSLALDALERCEARGGGADHLALVKTVALVDLLKERSGLVPSAEVLALALPHLSARAVEERLGDLQAWSVLIFKRHTGSFSIFAGSDFDIDAAVAEARATLPAIDPTALRRLSGIQPIMAKRHYHTTGALRWFAVDLAAPGEAADTARNFRPQNGATGLFLLLVGGDDNGEERARAACMAAVNAATIWPVVVGWTRDNVLIQDLAAELLALEHLLTEKPELAGDSVARREVNARITRLSADVDDRLTHALARAEWIWIDPRTGSHKSVESRGSTTLNAVASDVADGRYHSSPRISNELLNRIRPSSNAVAAQKELLKAMVERPEELRLGIEGFPAAGGLYDSLLGATSLHVRRGDDPGHATFATPPDSSDSRLAPLWAEAERLFQQAGPAGLDLGKLFEAWRRPPFGLRDGLMSVFAVAFLMSHLDKLAVYLDGMFQPKLTPMLVDRLTQDPVSVRLRWTEASEFHARVLSEVAGLVGEIDGWARSDSSPEIINVARRLVGTVRDLPPWVLRTSTVTAQASKLRNLAKLASDPNKFLLDDLPEVFGVTGKNGDEAKAVAEALRSGLRELTGAYPAMVRELGAVLVRELRVSAHPFTAELAQRADSVRGLTGNFRLDAFATRLSSFSGSIEEIEGLASLAGGKPPRDWNDRDVDHARVELATLAQDFLRAEALAHVKGREDGRVRMAIFIGNPDRPSPIKPDFEVLAGQAEEVNDLAAQLEHVVLASGAGREVALAAVAELGSRLAEPQAVRPPPRKGKATVNGRGAQR